MSTEIQTTETAALTPQLSPEIMSSLVLNGDMSKLNPTQKVEYYNWVCDRVGVDPATQPFVLIKLQGKEVLYPKKECTQQLTFRHRISHQVMARESDEEKGIYSVVCRATDPSGRFEDSIGAVSILNLKGESLANAIMKADSKSKRRATLDLLGLGLNDIEDVPDIDKYTPAVIEGSPIPVFEKVAKTKKEKKPAPSKSIGEDGSLYVEEIREDQFNHKPSNKPFKVWRIVTDDGSIFNTTIAANRELAERCMNEALPVVVEFRDSEYSDYDLLGIVEYVETEEPSDTNPWDDSDSPK